MSDREPGNPVHLLSFDTFTTMELPCTTPATIHRPGAAEPLTTYVSLMRADDLAFVTLNDQSVPVVLASDLPAYADAKG